MVPKVTLADDSNHIQLYDVVFRYAVGVAETNGALSMLEVTVPARRPAADGRERACLDGAIGRARLTPRDRQPARRAACASR